MAAFHPEMSLGDFLADGELVSYTWTLKGKHLGPCAGAAPTGNTVVVNGINIKRFDESKIVKHWIQFDSAGLFCQIGLLP